MSMAILFRLTYEPGNTVSTHLWAWPHSRTPRRGAAGSSYISGEQKMCLSHAAFSGKTVRNLMGFLNTIFNFILILHLHKNIELNCKHLDDRFEKKEKNICSAWGKSTRYSGNGTMHIPQGRHPWCTPGPALNTYIYIFISLLPIQKNWQNAYNTYSSMCVMYVSKLEIFYSSHLAFC